MNSKRLKAIMIFIVLLIVAIFILRFINEKINNTVEIKEPSLEEQGYDEIDGGSLFQAKVVGEYINGYHLRPKK